MHPCNFCTRSDGTPNIDGFKPIQEKNGTSGSFGTYCNYTYYKCGWCGAYYKRTIVKSTPALGGQTLSEGIEFIGWKLK